MRGTWEAPVPPRREPGYAKTTIWSLANGYGGVRPVRSTLSAGEPRTWGRDWRCCVLRNAGMGGKEWPRTRATGSLDTTRARDVRTCRATK
jgi:hypothetical protein